MNNIHQIRSALFGLAIGDAVGVPVEFKSREWLQANPVKDMIGYGTYNLPPGTFSDDSSLAFCLAEALTKGYDLKEIANYFIKWRNENYWTARGNVFDIGIATSAALNRYEADIRPELAGGFDENDNGNGSLMRILPLLFYIKDKPVLERFQVIKNVSSITHGHIRSVIGCFYYLEFARQVLEGRNIFEIYTNLKTEISSFLMSINIKPAEIAKYSRLLDENIYELPESQIHSSGYVVHTLEASIWSFLTTNSYRDAVLKAVNLGLDSDTTGAVCCGLAGLKYGYEAIPSHWLDQLARKNDIEDLAVRLAESLDSGRLYVGNP